MAKKRSHLSAKERATMSQINADGLQFDPLRRFRNALFCIAQSDPQWMIWVQNNLPTSPLITEDVLLLIEARARALVLKNYHFFGRTQISPLLFQPNWCFEDDGHLTPG